MARVYSATAQVDISDLPEIDENEAADTADRFSVDEETASVDSDEKPRRHERGGRDGNRDGNRDNNRNHNRDNNRNAGSPDDKDGENRRRRGRRGGRNRGKKRGDGGGRNFNNRPQGEGAPAQAAQGSGGAEQSASGHSAPSRGGQQNSPQPRYEEPRSQPQAANHQARESAPAQDGAPQGERKGWWKRLTE
jgi:hypothetical protein